MGFIKKGKKKTRIQATTRSAKNELGPDEGEVSELKGLLNRLNKSQKLTEFVKSTDWKQRCTLLLELIYQHFDGRRTAEELVKHDVIKYVLAEVTEDFNEVFEALQAKYPRMNLSSSVQGYLIHVRNLIKEETDFEYPDEILYITGTMIIDKFNGPMD
ncbi:MAG: hypothetical protein PVI53_00465 [Desulfobacteraceae bacterium]|jgi:hypothetical protein